MEFCLSRVRISVGAGQSSTRAKLSPLPVSLSCNTDISGDYNGPLKVDILTLTGIIRLRVHRLYEVSFANQNICISFLGHNTKYAYPNSASRTLQISEDAGKQRQLIFVQ